MTNEPPPPGIQFTRLTFLADFLAAKVEKKNFSMQKWGITTIGRAIFSPNTLPACNTTACAGGWACSIPSFQKEGLTMQADGPTYRGWAGHGALQKFFGLTLEQETFLFDSYQVKNGYTQLLRLTPKQWATRCRKFLKSL